MEYLNIVMMAGLLYVLVSIPLIFKLIPRNRFYGFITPRTLQSDKYWFPANRRCGFGLMMAGFFISLFGLVMEFSIIPNTEMAKLIAVVVPTIFMAIDSAGYLRRI